MFICQSPRRYVRYSLKASLLCAASPLDKDACPFRMLLYLSHRQCRIECLLTHKAAANRFSTPTSPSEDTITSGCTAIPIRAATSAFDTRHYHYECRFRPKLSSGSSQEDWQPPNGYPHRAGVLYAETRCYPPNSYPALREIEFGISPSFRI